jgi:DNA polymerase
MIHPETQRRAYLEALGIDVWVPKDEAEPGDDLAAHAGIEAGTLDWAGLRDSVAACTRCSLHQSRTQTVFGVGNPDADWMVIGEAPGAEEDRRGEPFVGRAGKLLDEMLLAVGQGRDSVFIANILKCRPPNNRDPKPEESAQCRGYLERQIELVQPKIILAVGRIAAQLLLETDTPVGMLRGSKHLLNETPLVVTYHPAYLLRSPSQKRKAWEDLCLARNLLAEAGT